MMLPRAPRHRMLSDWCKIPCPLFRRPQSLFELEWPYGSLLQEIICHQ